MRTSLALLAAWAGGGCYRSHALTGSDAGLPDAGTDAAPLEDAAPLDAGDAAPEEDASPPDEWEVAVAVSRGRISYAEVDVVAPASSSAFVADGALGSLGVGPDVTCGDIARGDDCLWAAWLQGSWGKLEWQLYVSHRCGDDPFAAPRVVPDEPFSGTPHVTLGGTADEWFGHFIGIDVAIDGSARVAWVDTRDGTNVVRLALMR